MCAIDRSVICPEIKKMDESEGVESFYVTSSQRSVKEISE